MKLSMIQCAKALYRTPIKVLTSKEAKTFNKHGRIQEIEKDITNIYSVKFNIPNTNFEYEKILIEDKRVGPAISLSKPGDGRYIFLEGSRLISEALHSSVPLKTLYFTDLKILSQIPLLKVNKNAEFLKVGSKLMKMWSNLDTPPGIMAISHLPKNLRPKRNVLPITVIIADLHDELILGSAVRSFVAGNVARIFYLPESCKMWNCKTLRSGAGSHFHVPILPTTLEEVAMHVHNTPNVYMFNVAEADIHDHNKHGVVGNDTPDNFNNLIETQDPDLSVLSIDIGNIDSKNFNKTHELKETENKVMDNNLSMKLEKRVDGIDSGANKNNHDRKINFDLINIAENKMRGEDFNVDSVRKINDREEALDGVIEKNNIYKMASGNGAIKEIKYNNNLSTTASNKYGFTDISELKYEGGDVCLILGSSLRAKIKSINDSNKVKNIGVKENLMPSASLGILIFQLSRLIGHAGNS